MTETKYRLVPLDEGGWSYLGVDVTNGNEAALFILRHGPAPDMERADLARLASLIQLSGAAENIDDPNNETEIDGRTYRIVSWDTDFDRALVKLIDRLVDMRMKNASVMSLALQLEMAL